MRVLVTGGAGYIGSHTLIELIAAGHEPFVVDNFDNSVPEALHRVGSLVQAPIQFARLDIRDRDALAAIFEDHRPEAVIHFAGLKAVGESAQRAQDYYDVNIAGTISLLAAMDQVGCRRIVFSSSATVYGTPQYLPFDEAHPCAPTNVYGRTKHMAETILQDWQAAQDSASAVLLRYFNPVGAHVSGQIGEDPQGIPNNLVPFIAQVAVGRRDKLMVFGNDYDTPDGTGIRDYIHVTDLARAHVAALEYSTQQSSCDIFNIGTGSGYSVLEVVETFGKVAGQDIPFEITDRRAGDIARSVADPERAHTCLGWRAQAGLQEMCQSVWTWQSAYPNGYDQPEPS